MLVISSKYPYLSFKENVWLGIGPNVFALKWFYKAIIHTIVNPVEYGQFQIFQKLAQSHLL
jgi:hypothetical protein